VAYDDIINSAAKQYGVLPDIIRAVIKTESNWDPDAERAEPQINDKSYGLMQVLLGTAKMIANNQALTPAQVKQPTLNILLGTKYLSTQLSKYPFDDAISAYNAGKPLYSSLPTRRFVNQEYVDRVKRNLAYYQSGYIGLVGLLGLGAVGFFMLRPARAH
jgi:soluble lytic murein transglycosylase-like protein